MSAGMVTSRQTGDGARKQIRRATDAQPRRRQGEAGT
ncbi:MAG: hypothetical protein QOF46_3266, partial [Paraburkholderia sp.]|nr:hypothetical protein [Paraburkholderia sp.]